MDEELQSVTFVTRQLYTTADNFGLARDQLLFFLCIIGTFIGGFIFNSWLPVSRVSATTRHAVLTAGGVFLCFFIYGTVQTAILLATSLVCQLLMVHSPGDYMHILVFCVSMGILAGTHVYNMVVHYGDYRVDYTGSLMVMTAKISGLAFALHDGKYKKPEQTTPAQKDRSLKEFPGTLPYFSYLFNFPCILSMPVSMYQEHEIYVTGSNLPEDVKSGKKPLRSNVLPAFIKAGTAIVLLGLHMVLCPKVDIAWLADKEFVAKTTFIHRVLLTYFGGFLMRCRYYFAFIFADAACNAAGFGHRMGDDGQSNWDMATNMHLVKVEFATSPQTAIGKWNVHTARWLRWIAYERCPWAPRYATFVLSAVWHGFYGGYLVSLPFSGFLVQASAQLRRHIRPHFQGTENMRTLYDHFTRLCTMIVMGYALLPFMLLEFWQGIYAWQGQYFYLTFFIVGVVLFVPAKRSGSAPSASQPNGDQAKKDSTKAHAE